MTPPRERWRDVVVLTVMVMIGLLLAAMLYFGAVYQNPPITFANEPFPVQPAEVRAGGSLVVTVDACRHTNVPVTIYRTWQNDLSYLQAPEMRGGLPVGCGISHFVVMVPEELPPGHYHIHYRFEYDVSPLSAPRIAEAETVMFTVVGDE